MLPGDAGPLQGEGGVAGATLGTRGIELVDAVEYSASKAGLDQGEAWSVDVVVPAEAAHATRLMRWKREVLDARLEAQGPFGARPLFDALVGRDVAATFFEASSALPRAALHAAADGAGQSA